MSLLYNAVLAGILLLPKPGPSQSLAAVSPTFADTISSDEVAGLFPAQARGNVLKNWPIVRSALNEAGLGRSRNLVIYALATIRVETRMFSPTDERPSKYSRTVDRASAMGIQDSGSVRPYGAYDSTVRTNDDGKVHVNKDLGNQYYRGKDDELLRARHGDPLEADANEGEKYKGRGFIQLTGRSNYEHMQKELNGSTRVNLVENPDAAGNVDIAARILAHVIASHGQAIDHLMATGQYVNARKLVNSAGLGMSAFLAVVGHFSK